MSTTITTPNDVMVTAQAADTPPSPSLRPADAPDGATPPTATKKNLTLALNIFFLLFCLYFFLVGLGLMGDSFKILAGKSAGNLFKAADHPIAGTCWPQPFHGRTPFWRCFHLSLFLFLPLGLFVSLELWVSFHRSHRCSPHCSPLSPFQVSWLESSPPSWCNRRRRRLRLSSVWSGAV